MKNYSILLLFFIGMLNANAQSFGDTITVQTLEFSDITKRRGWYVFPSDTNQYHKILMYYTLKCDPATTQDNFACGEWDYTTYTRLYQHQNINTPYYYLQNSNPDTIYYNNNAGYDLQQYYDYYIVYDNITNESNYSLGSGALNITEPLNTDLASGRGQYLYTASELLAAGLTAGEINKLMLDIFASGENIKNLTINIKHTTLLELTPSSYEKDSLVEVYSSNNTGILTGQQVFNFTDSFVWDGASNIVVDISFTNNYANNIYNGSVNYQLKGDDLSLNVGVLSAENGCLDFEGDDIVDVPASVFNDIDSAITISFWCYGDPEVMPFNSYSFEGRDINGYRVVNCHLPWSNSRVYWDAGNSGTSSYDRVDQAAGFDDFAGRWNHWAFTKDVGTGELKAYLNGNLFMSATGKTRLMSGITSFRIGGTASSGFNGVYDGKIDEFRIWNKALNQATIQNWMSRSIDNSHPDFINLKAAYDFNELIGLTASDYSGNGQTAQLMGLPEWVRQNGENVFMDINQTTNRPVIEFTQGSYQTHLDSTILTDTLYWNPISIVESAPYIDMNVSGISANYMDTIIGYQSGYGYTFNMNGQAVDSLDFSYDQMLVNYYDQTVHQIQNYVTPYGIGLDLGPNGFRWVYDVTDYTLLFNDTVEISAGNQQELIDLKFVMIKGIPPREVVDFETIWRGDYQHANIANDVSMPAVDIQLNPNALYYKVKTRTTGHWFGGFQNCAEFCPKYHNLSINGTQQFEWLNWKECADNPVISQGGTWIYDRAGWCPGTFGDTYDHDITPFVSPGSVASIDYGMEVTAGGMEGNYRTTVQLVSYGSHNFQNDAAVVDVIAPNKWEFHNRHNPMCNNPKILIENTGEQILTSAVIHYWICGGPHEIYTWTGSLEFGEKEEVELPIPDQSFWDHAFYCKNFIVVITEVNGVQDEYAYNSEYNAEFESPPTYPADIFFWTQTNNAAYENELYLKDDQGNVIFSRTNFQNATQYKDTVSLSPGCYTMEFIDNDEDGLSFFANNDGSGYLRIREVGAGVLKQFDSDFGDKIVHHFTVGYTLNNEDKYKSVSIGAYPNPSNSIFKLELDGFGELVKLEVYDAFGKRIISEDISSIDYLIHKELDLSEYENGIYFLKVDDGKKSRIKRLIKN